MKIEIVFRNNHCDVEIVQELIVCINTKADGKILLGFLLREPGVIGGNLQAGIQKMSSLKQYTVSSSSSRTNHRFLPLQTFMHNLQLQKLHYII